MPVVIINLSELDDAISQIAAETELVSSMPTDKRFLVGILNDIMEEHIEAVALGYQAMVDLGFFDEFEEDEGLIKDLMISISKGIEVTLMSLKLLAKVTDAKFLNTEGDIALNLELLDGNG
jgi:hypothetical protein